MNNLYFPAIKKYDNLTNLDLFAFYPIDSNRSKFEGSIDGLPRKTSLGNIIDFIQDNITVTAEINISLDGSDLGEFGNLNFSDQFLITDQGNGLFNISVDSNIFPTFENLFTTNLTLNSARIHDLNGNIFFFIDQSNSNQPWFYDGSTSVTSKIADSSTLLTSSGFSISRQGLTLANFTTANIILSRSVKINSTVDNTQASLTFVNPLPDQFELEIKPLTTFAPQSYSLPALSQEGFLFNNSSSEWSWVNIVSPNSYPLVVACSSEIDDLTVISEAITFRSPLDCTLTSVKASVTEAPTGDDILIQVTVNGVDVFTNNLVIDNGDLTSVGSTTTPVLVTPNLPISDDDEIKVEIVQIGSTQAGKGLKLTFNLEKI